MVDTIYISENRPFPNHTFPVLYYENVLTDVLGEEYTPEDVLALFERNGYTDGWVNIIMERHHFHSTAHEALACTRGEVRVQLGGPHGKMLTFRKGDVLLLPAGTSHKKLDGTENCQVVGAYPPHSIKKDFQYGEDHVYDEMKDNIANVEKPLTDPVTGSPAHIDKYWTE